MCNLANLTGFACGDNAAGTLQKAYIIPAGEITTFPAFKTTTNPGDSVTLDGAFTLTTNSGLGYWREIETIQDANSVAHTAVGEVGGKAFENRAVLTVAKYNAAQKELIRNLANMPVVAIVPDRNGEYHVIGTKDDPAYMEVSEGGTGTAIGDRRQVSITLLAKGATPPPTYDAVANPLDLTPNP